MVDSSSRAHGCSCRQHGLHTKRDGSGTLQVAGRFRLQGEIGSGSYSVAGIILMWRAVMPSVVTSVSRKLQNTTKEVYMGKEDESGVELRLTCCRCTAMHSHMSDLVVAEDTDRGGKFWQSPWFSTM